MKTAEALGQLVDDATVAYILENRKHFEDLRQVASQLAGLLVLAAAGSKDALPDHPMLEAGEQLYQGAADGLRRATVPLRARRHHEHLLQATASLGDALAEASRCFRPRGGGLEIDPILHPLRAGYAELERAAATLPGFELVAFERGCCAIHLQNEVKPAQ
jgi:hypothetical protein